jgi:hypothetical protein
VRDGAHDDFGQSGERQPDVQLRALEHQHVGSPLDVLLGQRRCHGACAVDDTRLRAGARFGANAD